MTRFNIKSKLGFTLIELLVVIGVLAVLAAIAIPSVAGLIDRANQSADQTNASEMTNAMERFVSEYELYRQDIMSNRIDFDNLDSAQGRVYNVTKAETIKDIEALESEAGLDGIRIDIDNKYAQNHATAKAVIENYMKTSSSTFTPKQSNMTYWYNKATGYIVVAEKDAKIEKLYKKLPTTLPNNNKFSAVNWINLSENNDIPDIELTKTELTKANNSYCLTYYVNIPNPEKYDIDLSKFLWLEIAGNHDDFGMQDRGNGLHGNYFSAMPQTYVSENIITITPHFIFGDEYYNTTTCESFRFCYEYEEDGEIKYIYSPTTVVYHDKIFQQ